MEITEIEILMTLAMLFYGVAILFGKKHRDWGFPRWVHISAGCTGFVLDMWATWKMESLRATGWAYTSSDLLLISHTIVSTVAIIFFLSMVGLGYKGKIRVHRKVAWFAFVPTWLASYTSGIALIF